MANVPQNLTPLFQAWDIKRKIMLHAVALSWQGTQLYVGTGSWDDWSWIEDYVLRQFIGKYDEDGHRAFEYDIVDYWVSDGIGSTKEQGYIEYDKEICAFVIKQFATYDQLTKKWDYYSCTFTNYFNKISKFKIIGNIFENPELFAVI